MFKRFVTFVFLLAAHIGFAQDNSFKLFLVGDAGDNEIPGEALDSLKSCLQRNPNSAVIFLGDNSYKRGLWGLLSNGFPGFDSSQSTQKKINAQLGTVDNYSGSVYFIPGNHDWWNETNFAKGKKKLKMEESFIEENLKNNKSIANPGNTFFPKDGKPGPESVELNDKKIRVVFLDTYWLVLLGFKKTPEENYALEKTVYHSLDSILADATSKKQKIVIAAHHPIYSIGGHDEPIKSKKLFKRIKASNQHYISYGNIILQMIPLLEKYHGLYYAAGHVHALQYYSINGNHYIVSGSGSKIHKVSKSTLASVPPCNETDCRIWNEKGFFEIDFSGNHEKVIMHRCDGKFVCDPAKKDDCKGNCK